MTDGPRVTKAVAGLLKAKLAEEREVRDLTCAYGEDGDVSIGVFITAIGLTAIGISDAQADAVSSIPQEAAPAPAVRTSKRDAVIALLKCDGGATLSELIAATGWLPHTTRAALTGLRKTGHTIDRGKRESETVCSIAVAVVA